MKRKAFTLSEILIALIVIGVVAALTIPNLIQKHQQKAWDTASNVFVKKLEEATKQMNAEGVLAGYYDTEGFVNQLKKYIKINKICHNNKLDKCISKKIYWGNQKEFIDISEIITSYYLGQEEWGTETLGIQFSNGINAIIAYNPECKQDPFNNQINGISCISMLYDVSGYKAPNSSGKDIYAINVNRLGRGSCAFELNGVCYGAPFIPQNPMSYEECMAQKDNLGINGCCKYSYCVPNYWAAAVKQCGGIDKLASRADLAALMNYAYNTDKITAESSGYLYHDIYLRLDNTKYEEAFKKTFESNKDYYWTSNEASDIHAWMYHPYSSDILVDTFPKTESNYYAICKY